MNEDFRSTWEPRLGLVTAKWLYWAPWAQTALWITTYAYGDTDRLTSATAPDTTETDYTYDDNGNETATGAIGLANDLVNDPDPVNIALDVASLIPGAASLKLERAASTAVKEAWVAERAFQVVAEGSQVDVAMRFAAQAAQVQNSERALSGVSRFLGFTDTSIADFDTARRYFLSPGVVHK